VILKSEKHEKQIIENLIEEGIVSNDQIVALSKVQLKEIEESKKSFFRKTYLFNLEKGKVDVLNNNFERVSELLLGDINISFPSEQFRVWGNNIPVLDQNNTKVTSTKTDYKSFGISLSNDDRAFIYKENIFDDKFLSESYQLLFNQTPKNKSDFWVSDIFISDDCTLLCITDRSKGKIYFINTHTDKILKSLDIRDSFSNKSLNLAISKKKNKIYVTDGISPNLYIIDLNTFSVETKNISQGVLGNIALSQDHTSLYCVGIKPKQVLKIINLKDFSLKKEFQLKGELFSLGDSPSDILTVSPDYKFIYLVTHISEPEPFTPVITVFDMEKEKAVQRFSIKDGTKLSGIGFSVNNPSFELNKSIIDLLIENKISDNNKIQEIRSKLENDFDINSNAIDLDVSDYSNNKNEENKKDIPWKIKEESNKIGYYNISPGLDVVLFKKCKEKIWSEYEIFLRDLSNKEKWENYESEIEMRFLKLQEALDNQTSMIFIRISDAIMKARQELEWYSLSIIRLPDFIPDYHFEVMFTRDQAIEWLREKERDELIETGLKTIISNCPNCEAQLLGSYTCRSCGFEIEKPEDKLRSLLKIATFDPLEHIKLGHTMIIDKVNHKIMEIDHMRKVVWEVKKDVLGSSQVEFDQPRDAVRLRNNITLVVDHGNNRVFKLTQKGKLYWELDYNYDDEHKLNKPISAGALENGDILICDYGNHRILEVNSDQEIIWQYGQTGVEGIGEGQLRFPAYIQRTDGATNIIADSGNHRVIEIQGNKIIWQFGNENNVEGDEAKGNGNNKLDTPLSAWKYENGHILILDSGNRRVIEVNEKKEIVWEYKTDQAKEEHQIFKPFKAYRLKNNKTLIIGETRVVEVTYKNKRVDWVCSIEDLISSVSSDSKDYNENIRKTKVVHGMVNPYAKKVDLSSMFGSDAAKNEAFIQKKKAELAEKSAHRSPVITTPGAKLSDLNFLMIDKIKSTIFQVNRKGETTWKLEDVGVFKPVYIHDNYPSSVYVCDASQKVVVEFDCNSKEILWEYNDTKLLYPRSSVPTSNGTILITDQLANKVFEVDKNTKELIWEYKSGIPYHSLRLENGNTLITDWGIHMVIEVNNKKEIVWSYGQNKVSGDAEGFLAYPEYSQRLENGNTLITDTKNSRIIEVSPEGHIVWIFNHDGPTKLMTPTFAKRLSDGNTIIVHSGNKQIVEVSSSSKVLWKYIHQDRNV
jgi:DNA-binding beta-propeller fold protein YncE